jgi:hypothetical protein
MAIGTTFEGRARQRKARAIWNAMEERRQRQGGTYTQLMNTVKGWDGDTWARFATIAGVKAPSSQTLALLMEGLENRVRREQGLPISARLSGRHAPRSFIEIASSGAPSEMVRHPPPSPLTGAAHEGASSGCLVG